MDLPDSSLLLNINLGDGPTKSNKQSYGNDKKKRIKKRKFSKIKKFIAGNKVSRKELGTYDEARLKQNTETSDTTNRKNNEQLTSKLSEKVISQKDGAPATTESSRKAQPRTQSKHVISSLFNKNPDIPSINQKDVKRNEEKIFSKKLFSELPLHPHLISTLDKMCLAEMTEVQQQAVPHILQGRDALIKSQTGSGKTLAYAVPLVQSLRSKARQIRRADGVLAVVLVPTRELALQSLAVLKKLVQSCIWIVPGMVIGGESRKSEKARLRKGINILVATPGRLLEHSTCTNSLNFSRLEYLIIDEADRLLDMGFEKDVTKLMNCILEQRQNTSCVGFGEEASRSDLQMILLSATLSTDVKRLASVALTDPVTINISDTSSSDGSNISHQATDSCEGAFSLPSSLNQYYTITPSKLRLVTLAAFILDKCKHSSSKHKVIVFLPTQEVVQFYYMLFEGTINTDKGDDSSDISDDDEASTTIFDIFALHGDMEQKYRTEVFQRFAATESGVLLCTDVAARGLHLPSVDWIVQLCAPASTEDYVHRVGRTARIGVIGNALLFLLPSEVKYLETLNSSKISLKSIEMNSVLKACLAESASLPKKSGNRRADRQAPQRIQEAATALQQSMEEWTYNGGERLAQAKSAFQSFVRSYTTYPASVKDIFHLKHLHLGHLAKSFCLREAPTAMTGGSTSKKMDKRKRLSRKAYHQAKKPRHDKMSEFASG